MTLVIVGVVVGCCLAQRMYWSSIVMCGILVILGFVYARAAQPLAQSCSFAVPVVATVREHFVGTQRNRYVVEDNRGCRLLVTAPRFPLYTPGDTVGLRGTVQPVAQLAESNIGYADYLSRRSIVATMRYPTIHILRRGEYAGERIRSFVYDRFFQLLPEPDASLMLALFFAEQDMIPRQLQEQFRITGTSHILAISGLQVSLLAGMVIAGLSLVPLSSWLRVVAALSLLWVYVWFIGAPLSAVRALLFWTLVLCSLRFGLLISLVSVLLLTVTFMVSYHPSDLLEIGFQLSVAAVVGMGLILFLTRPYLLNLGGWLWIVGLFIVTTGATLATLPLVGYHFGTLSLVGLLVNMLVVPPQPLLLALGLLMLALSFFAMPAALLTGFMLHLLIAWTNAVVRWGSLQPGVWITDMFWPAWLVGLYYVLVAGVAVLLLRWQGRSWREVWE